MNFKITKSKAPPQRRNNLKYPFDKMEVNDSFFVEGGRHKQVSVYGSAIAFSDAHTGGKWKFTTRKENNGYRLYRVK